MGRLWNGAAGILPTWKPIISGKANIFSRKIIPIQLGNTWRIGISGKLDIETGSLEHFLHIYSCYEKNFFPPDFSRFALGMQFAAKNSRRSFPANTKQTAPNA